MALIQGKQIADLAITTAKIAANAVTSAKVDASVIIAAGTNPLTANWSVGSFNITNLLDPVNAQDAATKNYVDAVAQGLDVHASCRFATAAALPAYTRVLNVITANAFGAFPTIDTSGAAVVTNRILLKDGAAGADNGIYTLTDAGSGGTPWVLTRATDADTSAEVTAGLFTFIEEGTANGDTGWLLTTDNPITLNTTPLTFSQFSGAGMILAGAGLLKTGNTIDLVIEGTSGGLTANTDNLQVNYALVGTLVAVDAAAAAAGTSQLIARGDHKHTVTTGTPVDVGTANAAGAATSLAKSDHVHRSPKPAAVNKNMTASVTVADGDAATATTVTTTPALGGYVGARVNGVDYFVGDGTKVGVDAYFSGDGGATARAMSAIVSGDSFRWNGTVVGFQLAATDKIDFLYQIF